MARKLASLRSFFKFCAREGMVRDNPARLVATPKLPKRIPAVLSAEEMNAFLDQLGQRHVLGAPARRANRDCERRRLLLRARPRHPRTALCLRAARQRTDRAGPGRRRSQGADAARARQGQQGTHRSLRLQGRAGAGGIRADPRRAAAPGRRPRTDASAVSRIATAGGWRPAASAGSSRNTFAW